MTEKVLVWLIVWLISAAPKEALKTFQYLVWIDAMWKNISSYFLSWTALRWEKYLTNIKSLHVSQCKLILLEVAMHRNSWSLHPKLSLILGFFLLVFCYIKLDSVTKLKDQIGERLYRKFRINKPLNFHTSFDRVVTSGALKFIFSRFELQIPGSTIAQSRRNVLSRERGERKKLLFGSISQSRLERCVTNTLLS